MYKKAIAGAIAIICTVNALGIAPNFNKNSYSAKSYSINAYAEGEEEDKVYNFDEDYADTSYYSYSMSKVSGTEWTVGSSYKYSIMNIKATHKDVETNKTVTDLNEYVIGLTYFSDQHEIDVKACSYVYVPDDIMESLNSKNIVLKDASKVLAIAASTFSNQIYIKSVDLDGIEYIGDSAFSGCPYITEETIPESVRYMGKGVFKGSGLKTLIFKNKVLNIPASFCENTVVSKVEFSYPKMVKNIGESAFANTVLTDYILPASSEDVIISKKAFANCKQLAKAILPDNTTQIDTEAFSGCTALSAVSIGNGVSKIGDKAFYGCSTLTDITLNNSILSLGKNAFMNCTSLVNAPSFPDNMVMDEGVFKGCSKLKKVSLPYSMTTVPIETFANCTSLTQIELGENVNIIGKSAFNSCTNLQEVTMYGYAAIIGQTAFAKCSSLRELPFKECGILKSNAFEECTALTNIDLMVTGDYMYYDDTKITGTPDFSKDTKPALGYYVFKNCTGLKTASVESPHSWGSGTFYGCSSLTSAYIGIKGYTSLPTHIFYGCSSLTNLKNTDFSTINYIGESAFQNCKVLKNVTFPNVIVIEKNAFNSCYELESICNGDIIATDYGESCFANCKNLKQKVNSTASTIDASAFSGSGITSLYIKGTVGNTVVLGSKAFSNCENLTKVDIIIPDGIEYSVGSELFSKCPVLTSCKYTGSEIPESMFLNCTELDDLTLPNAKNVKKAAFKNCTKLKSIKEMSYLNSIAGEAFANCSALTKTYANGSTTFVGDSQYSGCSSISTANVYALTQSMFKNCSALGSVTLSENITSIPQNAFSGCTNLSSINLENIKSFAASSMAGTGIKNLELKSVNDIASKAFDSCLELESVNLEADTIAASAFIKCANMTKAEISANKIGSSAFSDCSNLKELYLKNSENYTLSLVEDNAFANTSLEYAVIPDSVDTIGKKAFGYLKNKAVNGFEIVGTPGTTAETYANENGFRFVDASTFIPGVVLGDINGDKVIDAIDASLALTEYAAISTNQPSTFTTDEQKVAADVNGDTIIDSIDASYILSYYSYVSIGGKNTFKQYLNEQ